MLLAPRYHELDLPIYDDGSTLTDVSRLSKGEEVDTLSSTTFLRTIQADFYTTSGSQTEISLRGLLDITDRELQRAAELSRATVVGHQWGLMRQPKEGQRPFARNIAVPEDYTLVAEVDILKDVIELDLFQLHKALFRSALGTMAVGLGMARYNHGIKRREYRLLDMMPSQFVLGSCPKLDDKAGTWLVDIEPRLNYI